MFSAGKEGGDRVYLIDEGTNIDAEHVVLQIQKPQIVILTDKNVCFYSIHTHYSLNL